MLYDLGRGAIVGEMALLTDRPRAATVQAVRDSDLLLLRVSSFTSLLERSPALVTGMMRLLVDRLLAVDRLLTVERPQAPPPGGRTIAVASAGREPPRGRDWSPGSWRRSWPGSVRSSGWTRTLSTRHLGPDAAQRAPGRPRPGRADRVAARAWNAPMIA